MKWVGLILTVAAVWFLRMEWENPYEGRFTRPIAILGIAMGVVFFFEGFKREIVAELRRKDRDSSDA